jgi:MFS family permease
MECTTVPVDRRNECSPILLLLVATMGVLSPADKEVRPIVSIEQTALAQSVPDESRTAVFAWYNLVGPLAAALGALAGGFSSRQFLRAGMTVRFSISQRDVPTRQSYTMAVVRPDERSSAAGITTVARSIGAAISPAIAGYCLARTRQSGRVSP